MIKKISKIILTLALTIGLINLTTIITSPQVQAQSGQAVLLLGVDTGDLGRSERGRSDVMMLLTINGIGDKMTLTSIPRDSYVVIPGYGMDKINHAYAFGGPDLSVETVEGWLDIEIDNYIVVNMAGIQEVVNAVGGVEVTPPTTFSIGKYQFYAGQTTHIDGEAALAYARERYTSGGDYGRQERQREIVNAVIDKALSMDGVKNAWELYQSGSKNIETNFSIIGLANLGRKYAAFDGEMESYQLSGHGEMINGIYYEMINEESYQDILTMLDDQMNVN